MAHDYAVMAEACTAAAHKDELLASTGLGLAAAFADAKRAVHLTQAAVGNRHLGNVAKAIEELDVARKIYTNIHSASTIDPQFHAWKRPYKSEPLAAV